MHTFTLQDWTCIRGAETVTQAEPEWLDLEGYQDVFFWLQASSANGTPTITFQTSPTLDDSLFTYPSGVASPPPLDDWDRRSPPYRAPLLDRVVTRVARPVSVLGRPVRSRRQA
jgi:hypothetical protein